MKHVRFKADASQRLPSGDGVRRDEAGRVWCQLFPLGTWHRADFPGGKLELTEKTCAAFVENWQAEGSPPLPVDRHHVEDGPAAGWIEALDASGEYGPGLWGAIRWTDSAAKQIGADEYRFLSPSWSMGYASRTSGEKLGPWLYGAALLNDPYFHSMPRVAAKHDAAPTAHKGKDDTMDKKRICAALGLPEDTDDNAVMEALEAKCKAALEVEVEEKEEVPSEEKEEMKAAVLKANDAATKLQARVTELEGEKQGLEAALFDRDFSDLMKSPKAGLPAMGETLKAAAKALGLDAARKLVAALPDVPVAEMGTSGKAEEAETDRVAKYEALVAEKMKAGLKAADAYRAVNLEFRDLAESLHTNN